MANEVRVYPLFVLHYRPFDIDLFRSGEAMLQETFRPPFPLLLLRFFHRIYEVCVSLELSDKASTDSLGPGFDPLFTSAPLPSNIES